MKITQRTTSIVKSIPPTRERFKARLLHPRVREQKIVASEGG